MREVEFHDLRTRPDNAYAAESAQILLQLLERAQPICDENQELCFDCIFDESHGCSLASPDVSSKRGDKPKFLPMQENASSDHSAWTLPVAGATSIANRQPRA